ncbi:MAG: hypothetical protein M1165_01035 [Candidatus Pacearchaeota archaeon]|nr:hypothetical protein [Candidatus Pacearchaeota archaeon]
MDEQKITELKIQRLQAQSDYQKFEYSQITNYHIGIIACLVAIYIPIIVSNKDYSIISSVILIALIVVSHFGLRRFFKKNMKKIKDLSKEIERLYNELIT